MTVLDAIIAVGGMTEFASGNRTRIIRKTADGREQTITVHMKDIVKGKLKDNQALYAGDVIVVPETLF
jgi:polysaccharide export outer membrane protein